MQYGHTGRDGEPNIDPPGGSHASPSGEPTCGAGGLTLLSVEQTHQVPRCGVDVTAVVSLDDRDVGPRHFEQAAAERVRAVLTGGYSGSARGRDLRSAFARRCVVLGEAASPVAAACPRGSRLSEPPRVRVAAGCPARGWGVGGALPNTYPRGPPRPEHEGLGDAYDGRWLRGSARQRVPPESPSRG